MIIDNLIELNTINKSDLTAEKSHVLTTKTYVGKAGIVETGTMAHNGAVNKTLAAGESYTIIQGYHNGQGTITAKTLAEQTTATAQSAHILAPYTAWVTGGKVTGTMVNRTGWTSSVAMNGSVVIPQGYHDGTKSVSGPSITNRGAWTSRLSANGKVMIPEGYHNGSGYVDQALTGKGAATYTPSTVNQTIAANQWLTGAQTILGDSNLKPENIKEGVTIFGKTGTLVGGRVLGDADIYYKGIANYGMTVQNINGVTDLGQANCSIDSGQLTVSLHPSHYTYAHGIFSTTKAVNLSGYSKLRIAHNLSYSGIVACVISIGSTKIFNANEDESEVPKTVSITNYQVSGIFSLKLIASAPMESGTTGVMDGPITQIWLE